MKQLIIAAVLIFSSAISYAEQSDSIDYSHGFCVPYGVELKPENKTVETNNGSITGVQSYYYGNVGNFFNFENGRLEIFGGSWSGHISVTKPARPIFSKINLAIVAEYMQKPYLAECIAFEIYEMRNQGELK